MIRLKYSKWIIAIINISIAAIILGNWENLSTWIGEENNGYSPAIFILIVLLAAVPGVPFGLVGGMIGAKYGIIVGSLFNIAASTIAAMLVYMVFRYLLNKWGKHWLEKSHSMRRFDMFIRNRVFWSILIARLIPIMPAALINLYAGVFGLSFKIFMIATVLGKIPIMLVFAYVGDNIQSGKTEWMMVIVIYSVFLTIVYVINHFIQKRRFA